MTNFLLIILLAAAMAIIMTFIVVVLLPGIKSEGMVFFKGWIACDRDADGELWFFSHEPIRDEKEGVWRPSPEDEQWFVLGIRGYAMKWEDEPREVELVVRPKSDEMEVPGDDIGNDVI